MLFKIVFTAVPLSNEKQDLLCLKLCLLTIFKLYHGGIIFMHLKFLFTCRRTFLHEDGTQRSLHIDSEPKVIAKINKTNTVR